jgi:hypothetical protein
VPVAPTSEADVPEAVMPVAPGVPSPPNVLAYAHTDCVAVLVEAPTAVSVNVVHPIELVGIVPVIIADVNGVASTCGELILAVFVIEAEVGVAEYAAINAGLITEAPSSTVEPPEKDVIEKPGAILSAVS